MHDTLKEINSPELIDITLCFNVYHHVVLISCSSINLLIAERCKTDYDMYNNFKRIKGIISDPNGEEITIDMQ